MSYVRVEPLHFPSKVGIAHVLGTHWVPSILPNHNKLMGYAIKAGSGSPGCSEICYSACTVAGKIRLST